MAAKCPGTRIHAGSVPLEPAEWIGLKYLAGQRGLKVLPVAPDQPGRCPVIYWTENRPPNRVTLAAAGGNALAAADRTAGWGVPAAQLRNAALIRSKNGAILVIGGPKG